MGLPDMTGAGEDITAVYGIGTDRDAAAYAAVDEVPGDVDLDAADGTWYEVAVADVPDALADLVAHPDDVAPYKDVFTEAAAAARDEGMDELVVAEVTFPDDARYDARGRRKQGYHPLDELSGLPHPVDDPRFGPEGW